jgi:hypothetical protein
MAQIYEVLYTLSIEDATPRTEGFSPARGARFQETQNLTTPERPPLQHVIEWINARADAIREAINEMLNNPGTKILRLHARLPIRSTAQGHYFHEAIPDIPVDGLELDRLKAKVIERYEAA